MPDIVRCPDCNRETYAGLPACPHCKNDLWTPKPASSISPGGEDERKSPFMGHEAYEAARNVKGEKQRYKSIMKVIAGVGVVLAFVLEFLT